MPPHVEYSRVFLFPPKLPVSAKARAWTELALDRLESLLGAERLRDAPVILPTPDFFPDGGQGTEEAARALFARVCTYMRVDPARLRLVFWEEEHADDALRRTMPYWEGGREGAAGFYHNHPEEEAIVIAVRSTNCATHFPLSARWPTNWPTCSCSPTAT